MGTVSGRVKLEDEADEFRVPMPEFDRLNGCIEWIDLSLVERRRTPKWTIQIGIRYHIASMSTRDASQFLNEFGVRYSHVAIHNWYIRLIYSPCQR